MWTKNDITDQTGKIAIVTGANTGIGYETALALIQAGAHVIVAGRDHEKITAAVERMKRNRPKGSVESAVLNLSSLQDVAKFAVYYKAKYDNLDILINNAGIMTPPPGLTDDGFETQFGVNFLGHFALTAHLYPELNKSVSGRVVTISSGAARFVEKIDFDNLRIEKEYDAFIAYATSKLADVQFAFELNRRLEGNSDIKSVAVHPGVVYTDLQRFIPEDKKEAAFARFKTVMAPWQGALPTLYAATEPSISGGSFYAPDGEDELSGYPALATRITPAMNDSLQGKELWEYAEKVTGLCFP